MTSVVITHADEPLGRRVVKTLFHDPRVKKLLLLGQGPPPHQFDRFLAGSHPRVVYLRADLSKHRSTAEMFHSTSFRAAAIDVVIHLPRHGSSTRERGPVLAGLPTRTAEARLMLQYCLNTPSVKTLVAVGSAFVYRLPPGNANRLGESSELDLNPNVAPDLRSWIDCDMLFHSEIHNEAIRVVLLRVPTVVSSGGYVYLNPSLAGRAGLRVRPLGFDPLCTLVSDKDVARAVQSATHASVSGVFNVAGNETLPLSMLGRWTRRPSLPVPGPMLRWAAGTLRMLRREGWRSLLDGPHLRFGFTLDTRRAEEQLGFRPSYRIGLARGGDGNFRLETSPI